MAGLPKGYGKANNPTGKGGDQRWMSKYAATEALSKIIIDVLMESPSGRTLAEDIVRKQVSHARAGDLGAAQFLFDRVMGKPAVAVTLAGDPDNPVGIRLIERLIVDPKAANTNGEGLQATA